MKELRHITVFLLAESRTRPLGSRGVYRLINDSGSWHWQEEVPLYGGVLDSQLTQVLGTPPWFKFIPIIPLSRPIYRQEATREFNRGGLKKCRKLSKVDGCCLPLRKRRVPVTNPVRFLVQMIPSSKLESSDLNSIGPQFWQMVFQKIKI